MRELKFRVWNKDYRIMDSPFNLYEAGCLNGENGYPSEGYILMQFTGLKDKNGAEIYEGDIVRFSDNTLHEGVLTKCEYTEKRAQFIYIFITGGNKTKATDMYDTWRKYEVIGNIYENPELVS